MRMPDTIDPRELIYIFCLYDERVAIPAAYGLAHKSKRRTLRMFSSIGIDALNISGLEHHVDAAGSLNDFERVYERVSPWETVRHAVWILRRVQIGAAHIGVILFQAAHTFPDIGIPALGPRQHRRFFLRKIHCRSGVRSRRNVPFAGQIGNRFLLSSL